MTFLEIFPFTQVMVRFTGGTVVVVVGGEVVVVVGGEVDVVVTTAGEL